MFVEVVCEVLSPKMNSSLLFQIVKLLDHFCHSFSFYLVLEYVVSGLPEMLYDDEIFLTDSHLKTYARMLLSGVVHMHATNIVHRVSDRVSKTYTNISRQHLHLCSGPEACEFASEFRGCVENSRFQFEPSTVDREQ